MMKGKKWWSLLLAACLLLAFLPASAKDVPCPVCGQIHEGDCPVTAAREKIDGLPAPDEVEAMNREKQEQVEDAGEPTGTPLYRGALCQEQREEDEKGQHAERVGKAGKNAERG